MPNFVVPKVRRHHGEVLGQAVRDLMPHDVALRIAVGHQQGGPLPPAMRLMLVPLTSIRRYSNPLNFAFVHWRPSNPRCRQAAMFGRDSG